MLQSKWVLLATASVSLLGGAADAQTASPDAAEISELVVTAQRREEKLQDVAMSVSAYSGDQLSKMNVTSGKDLVRMTPGLSLSAPTGETGAVVFTMRGVGLNDYGVGNEAPVAIYVDDVYQASTSSATALTFDLNRVEVLRGPQGTLFGRNATGGLVHFVSRRPTQDLEGYADLRGGGYGYSGEAVANVPLTANLATRLALSAEHVDGWMDNALGKDGNNANKQAGRFQALYDREDFSALVILRGDMVHGRPQYTFQATDPGPDGGVAVVKPAHEVYGVPNTPAFALLDDRDPYSGAVDQPGHSYGKSYGGLLRLEGLVHGVDVVSITDWTRTSTDFIEDTDASPAKIYELPSWSHSSQYSQEIRASQQGDAWGWVAGGYLFHNHVYNKRQFLEHQAGVAFDAVMNQTVDSAALFGEVNVKVAPTVTLVAGLRYTRETRKIDYVSDFVTDVDGSGLFSPTNQRAVLFAFGPSTAGDLAKRTDESVSGRLRLEWRPSETLLGYAAFNRGFKSGGFNNPLTAENFNPARMPYRPERLDSYEVGFKSEVLGARLQFNADAFYYDYQGFQAFKTEGVNSFLSNVDAEIYGLNVEFVARPTQDLTLMGGLQWLHARAFDVGAPGVDRTLAQAPEISAVVTAHYEREALGGLASADVSLRYLGEQFFDIGNAPITIESGYATVDARVGYRVGERGPEVFVTATNLFDKQYRLYAIDISSLGFSQVMMAQPRRVALGVRVAF